MAAMTAGSNASSLSSSSAFGVPPFHRPEMRRRGSSSTAERPGDKVVLRLGGREARTGSSGISSGRGGSLIPSNSAGASVKTGAKVDLTGEVDWLNALAAALAGIV